MRKILSVLVLALLVVGIVPLVAANTPTVGTGTGIIITPEDFKPLIWMNPDSRVVLRNPILEERVRHAHSDCASIIGHEQRRFEPGVVAVAIYLGLDPREDFIPNIASIHGDS